MTGPAQNRDNSLCLSMKLDHMLKESPALQQSIFHTGYTLANHVRFFIKKVTFCMQLRFCKLLSTLPLLPVGLDPSSPTTKSAESSTEENFLPKNHQTDSAVNGRNPFYLKGNNPFTLRGIIWTTFCPRHPQQREGIKANSGYRIYEALTMAVCNILLNTYDTG